MFNKFFKTITFTASLVFIVSQSAEARPEYVAGVQAALGSNSISCGACHSGAAGEGNANLPFASTWRSGADMALSDSDGDGFNNREEVNGADLNNPAVSPFTLATGGVARTNVYIIGDTSALEKAITAIPNATIPADSQLLGNLAVDVYADPTLNAPITLVYKAGGAASTSTVYAIDAYSNIPFAATDWTLNTNGSIQVNQWPAGAAAGTHDIAVVRKIPVVPAPGPRRGGDDEGKLKCMTSHTLPTSMMVFALLAVGLLIRRKQS